jgi:hypothetical protein
MMDRYQIARMSKSQIARRIMLKLIFEKALKSMAGIKKTSIQFWKFNCREWKRTNKSFLLWYFTVGASVLAGLLYVNHMGSVISTPKRASESLVSVTKDQLAQVNKLASEYAYFEGQKDVLEGDIRIAKKDSAWVWVKPPWDGDTSIKDILYHPELGQAGSMDVLMKRIKN